MIASLKNPWGWQGRCPCCNAGIPIDLRQSFGITACSGCDRLIWWLIPSEDGAIPFLSSDFKHRLLNDPGADSLDGVELVMKVEEEFGIEIPDKDAGVFKSIEDVVGYIEKHRKKKK